MADVARYWFGVLKSAAQNWLDSHAFVYAAALAFFTVFSIAPVVIVAVSITGIVLGEQAAQGQIIEKLQGVIGTEAATVVQTAVANSRVEQSGIWPTVLGVALTLVGATTVFAQMQVSLNRIWEVVPRPERSGIVRFVIARMLSLTIVLVIGFILLVSLLLSVALSALTEYAEAWLPMSGFVFMALDVSVSFAVITALFAAMFRVLPDVTLAWRDVLVGAAITAGLFTLGRSLIAIYLAHTAPASAYGAAGSLVLLLWVNYSSLILLFGAAVTRAHLEARGLPIVPRSTAVRVKRELMRNA
jgi:membrane protein